MLSGLKGSGVRDLTQYLMEQACSYIIHSSIASFTIIILNLLRLRVLIADVYSAKVLWVL